MTLLTWNWVSREGIPLIEDLSIDMFVLISC